MSPCLYHARDLDLYHGLCDVAALVHGRGHWIQEFVVSFAHVDRNRGQDFEVCGVLCPFDLVTRGVGDEICVFPKETGTGFGVVLLPSSLRLQDGFGGVGKVM